MKELSDGTKQEEFVFIDGSCVSGVDTAIFSTGYKYHYPFMEESIKLNTEHWLVCTNLYKSTFLMNDPNVMYIGMQDQIISFTHFDVQAWAAKEHCLGRFPMPQKPEMEANTKMWVDRLTPINDMSVHFMECCQLQIDHQDDIAKISGYYDRTNPVDGRKVRNINNKDIYDGFYGWKKAKMNNIMTFRDQVCKSCFDDTVAPKALAQPWKDIEISYRPYAKL